MTLALLGRSVRRRIAPAAPAAPAPEALAGPRPLPCPALSCSKCDRPLAIRQPEPDHPNRLLGTCGQCSRWYQFRPSKDSTGFLDLWVWSQWTD